MSAEIIREHVQSISKLRVFLQGFVAGASVVAIVVSLVR